MRVVITSATRNAGLAAIRALAQSGIEVVGTDERELPLKIRSRYLRKQYLTPSWKMAEFKDALLEVVRQENPDVLIPLLGINVIVNHAQEFERFTRLLTPAPESFQAAYDNRLTLIECQKLGIPCPRILDEAEALNELDSRSDCSRSRFAVVIKPRADIGGGTGLHFIRTKEALLQAKQKIESEFGEAVIQEYIPGATESMRTVNLVFDEDSCLAAYFTTRKIRQWPPSGGISALSVSTNDFDLVRSVLPLFEEWKWRGPVEIEFKIDPRDGIPKVIEVNPRFPGYLGFPVRCGANFPLIACRLALGGRAEKFAFPSYREGIKFINPPAYVKAVYHDFLHGGRPLRAILNSLSDLKGKKVLNNMKFRDTLVVIAKLMLELKRSKA